MENRDSYLMGKFGGTKAYGEFFRQLRDNALEKGYIPQAIDTAIDKLTDLLKSYDLTKVRNIKAWARRIFYREAGKEPATNNPLPTLGLRESDTEPSKRDKLEYQDVIQENHLSRTLRTWTSSDLEKSSNTYSSSKNLTNTLEGKLKIRIEQYLDGDTEQEIADSEGKSRQAISKQISPQLEKWGWTKEEVARIRGSWLLEHLKSINSNVEIERQKCFVKGVCDQAKLREYHQYLYNLISDDKRIRKFYPNLSLDDIPEIDTLISDLSRG